MRSVGIDAEPHGVLPNGVLDAISLPVERTEISALPGGLHWDRILFCAKEATYKAWYPVTRRWLGFEDAHIVFDVDASGAAGGFDSSDPHRPGRAVGSAADHVAGPVVGAGRAGADGDRAVTSREPAWCVDKPAGMTSHDVVGRCRRIFATRKVGHAGTLDPMATGVLVVGIERATKILGLLTATDKSYSATIRLGQTTSTEDADGEVLQTVSAADVADDDRSKPRLRRFAATSRRCRRRSAPIKVDGKRAYRLVREGHTVELAARAVHIGRFEVLDVRRTDDLVDVDVEVDCSSGTYIRALARDVGAALGVGGHLTALRRTRVGTSGSTRPARSTSSPRHRVCAIRSTRPACWPFRVATSPTTRPSPRAHGRALAPAGIDGVYAATAPDGRVDRAAARPGRPGTKSVVVVRPATL